MSTTTASVENALALAKANILVPAGLDEGRIGAALGSMLGHAIDSADLYFQLSQEESWGLEDGIVKEGSSSIEQGVGVRALAGERTGFAYSDEIMPQAIEEAAHAARAIANRGQDGVVRAWHQVSGHRLYAPVDPVHSLQDNEKVAWLERIDRETRRMDPRVKQVIASVYAGYELIKISGSNGTPAADARPLVRLNVSVIVEQEGRREQGYNSAC